MSKITPCLITKDNLPEFIGQLIDVYEDVFTEAGVMLKNPERDDDIENGDVDTDSAAIIYGTDYGILSDAIEAIAEPLINTNRKGATQEIIQAIDTAAGCFLSEGRMDPVPESCCRKILDKLAETCRNWNIS